jgi:hypothetical protein
MEDQTTDRPPDWVQMESVKSIPVAAEMTTLSADTLKREYSEWIVQLSPRRRGMKLKHILQIANGIKPA